ncbi:fibronectin type III domain-containing protein [Paenibacillus caui]|uniref:fibronectin type III domain-containing protein n=1 Tax=Paenibacillus caui TaxID=2873927 RepID=UPI001F452BA8|nr:fibronectin type III domain-containing protein [Paenibacillus caui]
MKQSVMKKMIFFLAAIFVVSVSFHSTASASAPPNTIANGNFETGDFTGWAVNGNAFSVVNDTNWGGGEDFNHKGTYHVWGYKNAGDAGTGTLQSGSFTVWGGKYMDFLIGGGNDLSNLYVALVDASNGQVLVKATGSNSESYRRVIWDISPYQYKQVYFKIVDTSTGDWGHINVDDIHTTADTPFSDSYSTLPNHDFEDGNLTGWIVNSGTAFSAGDVTSDSTYGDGPFNQNGTYHLWSYKDGGDGDTGVLQSYFFKIGGQGQIDFLISGGNDIDNEYVALVRASDGKELFKATGSNSEQYTRVSWDASVYGGDYVYVKIVDNATGSWGHINLDDLNVQAVNYSVKNDITPPTAPANLVVTDKTSTSVTVSWTASTDNIGVTGYNFKINGSSTPTGSTATSYTFTGLNPGVTYYIKVSATDAAGNESANSETLVVQN